jgi:hypothetical protein
MNDIQMKDEIAGTIYAKAYTERLLGWTWKDAK